MITNEKKLEYWDHCANEVLAIKPKGVTRRRIEFTKGILFDDDNFWSDIIDRHGGLYLSPLEMKFQKKASYDHMIGNFTACVREVLVRFGKINIKRGQ